MIRHTKKIIPPYTREALVKAFQELEVKVGISERIPAYYIETVLCLIHLRCDHELEIRGYEPLYSWVKEVA